MLCINEEEEEEVGKTVLDEGFVVRCLILRPKCQTKKGTDHADVWEGQCQAVTAVIPIKPSKCSVHKVYYMNAQFACPVYFNSNTVLFISLKLGIG
jgi:hypothetical protein